MKITLITPALVAILGLALAGATVSAQAATTTNSPSATAPAKAAKTKYSGSITAIDATSVTVATAKKVLTLAITPKTTFKKDTKAATVADFAVGDTISGSYTTDSTGATSASSLIKKSTAAATPTPAKTAAPATTPAAQ
jgi:hypothetical protein